MKFCKSFVKKKKKPTTTRINKSLFCYFTQQWLTIAIESQIIESVCIKLSTTKKKKRKTKPWNEMKKTIEWKVQKMKALIVKNGQIQTIKLAKYCYYVSTLLQIHFECNDRLLRCIHINSYTIHMYSSYIQHNHRNKSQFWWLKIIFIVKKKTKNMRLSLLLLNNQQHHERDPAGGAALKCE